MEGKNFGAIAGRHDFKVQQLDKKMISAGKTDYVILLPEQPTWQEEYAARELQYFFELATGIGLRHCAKGDKFPFILFRWATRVPPKKCVLRDQFSENPAARAHGRRKLSFKGRRIRRHLCRVRLLGCILGWRSFPRRRSLCDATSKISACMRWISPTFPISVSGRPAIVT